MLCVVQRSWHATRFGIWCGVSLAHNYSSTCKLPSSGNVVLASAAFHQQGVDKVMKAPLRSRTVDIH